MKTNKRSEQIKKLEVQRNKLAKEINVLVEKEELEIVLPKCRALVGTCLKSSYDECRYAKLLQIVENTEFGIYFMMEVFNITEQGSVYFFTDSCFPYTNKEWWDADIPISGWERVSEEEYQREKDKARREFSSMKILRKFLLKRK